MPLVPTNKLFKSPLGLFVECCGIARAVPMEINETKVRLDFHIYAILDLDLVLGVLLVGMLLVSWLLFIVLLLISVLLFVSSLLASWSILAFIGSGLPSSSFLASLADVSPVEFMAMANV